MTREEALEIIRRKNVKVGGAVLKAWFLREPEAQPILDLLESLVAQGILGPKDHDYVLLKAV